MKQKVVIKLSVHDERARAKAMKTAVGVDGVNSASYQQDKNQMEVMGEGIDVILLTTSLRKRKSLLRKRKSLTYAELVSVSPVEEKKKEEKKEEKKSEPAQLQYVMGCPQYVVTYPSYEEPPNICTIL